MDIHPKISKQLAMKKTLLLTLLFSSLSFILFAQTITYKANKWGNTKLHKSWTTALDNPVLEKVVVVQTDKSFKITFGGKRTLAYTIVNSEKLNPTSTKYNVKSGDKKYSIQVMFIDNAYFILCENEWGIADITDMSSSD
jgi:hypothetical protein